MAPSKSTADMDPSFKFIMSVLKNCETIKPNWDKVAHENGIAYARNANARFKDILKKQGYRFENGLISDADGNADTTNVTATTTASLRTPKKVRKGSEGGKTGSGKKRTAVEMEEDVDVKDEADAAAEED